MDYKAISADGEDVNLVELVEKYGKERSIEIIENILKSKRPTYGESYNGYNKILAEGCSAIKEEKFERLPEIDRLLSAEILSQNV